MFADWNCRENVRRADTSVVKKKTERRSERINDGGALETVGRRLGGQKDSRARYAMWDNGPAGSRRTRSRVFAGGLFRYIVCNLIISVVNNSVNKVKKTKTEQHFRSDTLRWNKNITRQCLCLVFRIVRRINSHRHSVQISVALVQILF